MTVRYLAALRAEDVLSLDDRTGQSLGISLWAVNLFNPSPCSFAEYLCNQALNVNSKPGTWGLLIGKPMILSAALPPIMGAP